MNVLKQILDIIWVLMKISVLCLALVFIWAWLIELVKQTREKQAFLKSLKEKDD